MGRAGAGIDGRHTRARPPTSWPPLLGRDAEIEAAGAWLGDPGARLLTLTGLPGSGRSHLASSISDLASNAIVIEHGVSEDVATIVGRCQNTLVVLDHALPSDVKLVEALLLEFEPLRIIAVALRPLGLPRERCLRVGGLALPAPDASFEAVCAAPSVALFAAQAAAASAFVLDVNNAASVVEICIAVDGLPSAIELAATRTRLLSVSALAAELSQRTVVAALGEALRRTVETGYDLLSEDAAAMLLEVSQLHCSFTVDDAHVIADKNSERQVIDLLAELDSVNLVNRTGADGSDPRFVVPRLVREVMADRSSGAGDEARMLTEVRHARHVSAIVRAAADAQFRTGGGPAIDVIDEWFTDALVAVSTLTRLGRHDDGARLLLDICSRAPVSQRVGDVTASLERLLRGDRLALAYRAEALCSLAVLRGHRADPAARHEAQALLVAGVELTDDLDLASQRRVLLVACCALGLVDDPSVVLRAASAGLDVTESLRDLWAWGRFSISAAAARHQLGEPAEEQAWAAYSVACALDDPFLRVRTALLLHTMRAGCAARPALPRPADLVEMASTARDELGRGAALLALASQLLTEARWPEAAEAIDGAFAVAEQLASWPLAGHAFMLVVVLSSLRGDHARAARFEAVVTRVREAVVPSAPSPATAAYDRVVAGTRIALGADGFRDAIQQGAAMSWSCAIREGRSRLRDASTVGGVAADDTQQAIVHPALTERELEVVTMLAEGYTNKDVARRLGVTPKTVMHHNATIYRKLDVRGRAGAVAAALRLGLLHEAQHAAST